MPALKYTTLEERLQGASAVSLSPQIKEQLGKLFAVADFIMDLDASGPSFANILIAEDDTIYKIDPAEANLLTNNINIDDYAELVKANRSIPVVSHPSFIRIVGSARFNGMLHEQLKGDPYYLRGLETGYKIIMTAPSSVIIGILKEVQKDLQGTAYALREDEFTELFMTLWGRQKIQWEVRLDLRNQSISSSFPKDYIKPAGTLRSIKDFDYLMPLNPKIDKFVEYTPAAKMVIDIVSLMKNIFGKKPPKDLAKLTSIYRQMLAAEIPEQRALLRVEAILSRYWLNQASIKDERMKEFSIATLARIQNQVKFGYDQHVKNFQSFFLTPHIEPGAKELQSEINKLLAQASGLYKQFLKKNNNNLIGIIYFHAQMQQYLAFKYAELADTINYGKRNQCSVYHVLLTKINELCAIEPTESKNTNALFTASLDNKVTQKFLSDNKRALRNNVEMLEQKYGNPKVKMPVASLKPY